MADQQKFQWRSFTTFVVVLSFITLGFSGLILYVAPPGRIANWSGWTIILASKAQWQTVHTIFSFLFIGFGSLHLIFNWKVLMGYLRTKLGQGMSRKRELAYSTLGVAVIWVMSLISIPPFSTVMEFGDTLKNSWTAPTDEPPIAHAELLTVEDFSKKMGLSLDTLIMNLRAEGMAVEDGAGLIGTIAQSNGITPMQLYQKALGTKKAPKPSLAEGGGFGRKTVSMVCDQYEIPLAEGLRRLHARGMEADGSTSLKDLALKENMTPIQVAKIVVGEPD